MINRFNKEFKLPHTQALQKSSLLFYFKDSWGEVDGYIPIIVALRNKFKDYFLIAVFESKTFETTSAQHLFLYETLKEYTDCIVSKSEESAYEFILHRLVDSFPTKRFTKLLFKFLKSSLKTSLISIIEFHKLKIDIIFKDHGNDSFHLRKIQDLVNTSKIVVYPHGTMIRSNRFDSIVNRVESKNDLVILSNKNDLEYFNIRFDAKNLKLFGHPKYDKDWLEHISKINFLYKREFKKLIVFFTRSHGESSLSYENYIYLITSAVKLILSYSDFDLILKPHPRQNMDDLTKLLSIYMNKCFRISNLPSVYLAERSDLTISMFSSTISDAIFVKKPVIQYYIFDIDYPQYIKLDSGRLGSIYEELMNIKSASSYDELKLLLDRYINHGDEEFEVQKIFDLHEFSDKPNSKIIEYFMKRNWIH